MNRTYKITKGQNIKYIMSIFKKKVNVSMLEDLESYCITSDGIIYNQKEKIVAKLGIEISKLVMYNL